jgi:hypothetical protein
MINLLPANFKQDVSYARRNTALGKWIIFAILALAGVGLIVLAGLFYMDQTIKSQTKTVEESRRNLEVQNVKETQQKVEEISSNTKLAMDVLSREILFSKLIRQIGSALPENTALKSLRIDEVNGGTQLDAAVASFDAGAQLQLNLQDPRNGVFEKADINSINCGDKPDESTGLLCEANIRALFGKNNSYMYINPEENKQ